MVLSREQFLERINERIGDGTEDADISFLEDMTETFDSITNSSNEDWKKKYEENDANWRQKYKDRFFNGSTEDDDFEDNNNHSTPTSFEQLFTVKEN